MVTPKRFSFQPMLCESTEQLPEGEEWRYELKLDGYRALAAKSENRTQLWSRNQKDFTRRFPSVAKGISELPNDTVIDGEIVALDPAGKPSFGLLSRLRQRSNHACTVCFRSTDGARQRCESLAARRSP
jgi:bifunctional non-homologous end joining protein LigD